MDDEHHHAIKEALRRVAAMDVAIKQARTTLWAMEHDLTQLNTIIKHLQEDDRG